MKELKRINDELRADAPDLSQKISQSVDWSVVNAQNKPEKSRNGQSKKRPIFALAACAAAVAIILPLCIVMLGTGGGDTPAKVHAAYDVLIDVNPNIVFTVDENDVITAQRGANEDGIVFLYSRKYVGQNIHAAARSVAQELQRLGLITKGSIVRISAYEHSTRIIKDDIQTALEKKMEEVLNSDVTMLFLSDDELDKIEEYYKNHTVKADEKQLINDFKEGVIRVAKEKLASAADLLQTLKKYTGSENITLSAADAEKLSAFVTKYKFECEFDIGSGIDEDDFSDFYEELEELCEELGEDIKEIEQNTDDYSEMLEDLIELVKDCLW